MSNCVYLWVDRVSERSTCICVEFEDRKKLVLRYSESGLTYSSADQKESPEEEILVGYTNKTSTEVVMLADTLVGTSFRTYDAIKRNHNQFCNELSVRLCGERIPSKYHQVQSKVGPGAAAAAITTIVLSGAVLGAVLGTLFKSI